MNRKILFTLLLVLALLGLADSWYLFESAVTDTSLVCDIGTVLDGCNIVAQSPYSRVFGIPLAFFGVVYYALLLVLAGVTAAVSKRILSRALWFLAIVGALASAIFVFIQVALIKALCIYCIGSAVIAFAVLGIVWALKRQASLDS